MKIQKGHWGTVYRPKGRNGEPTRWWWLCYKLPGERRPRRHVTRPQTDDEAEARRQLSLILGEKPEALRARERLEDLLVRELLWLYVAECRDTGTPIQVGRIEPWVDALGSVRALDVRRDTLDTLCRRWRRVGPTWGAGRLDVPEYDPLVWEARDPRRQRPLGGASCNRLITVLRRAYRLGLEKLQLVTPLTFPHFEETTRGEYITEDQCRAICEHFQAKRGRAVKADVFRLAYLLGIRKGQLRKTKKRNVIISGPAWSLRWLDETKTSQLHEVRLVGEALAIVQRAWTARRPDCDLLFHVDGTPLGPMTSELRRTCAALGIRCGRGKGIVFHDSRHSAVTNLSAVVGEAVAMTITGHADPGVFKRYNVRRDDVQAEALERQEAYLAAKRGTDAKKAVPTVG